MEKQFGDRLRELRTERELTQEELAKVFNTGKASISHYESNRRLPDAITIEKFADFFGVSLDYMMGKSDIRNPYENIDKVSNAVEDDPELKEFWEELKERESLQLMFKQVKNLDDKSIKQVMRIIKAIEDEESRED